MQKLQPLQISVEWLKKQYGEFMTTKEVAQLLKVSERYIRWLCGAGELEAFLVGKKRAGWRIKTESVWEFLVKRYTLNLNP